MKHNYEVIVGNIGRVYTGTNNIEAMKSYSEYADLSNRGVGSAADEPVTVIKDGDIVREFTPRSTRKKAGKSVTILTEKRGQNDYVAHLLTEPSPREAGRSQAEAIGKLILSMPDQFNVVLHEPVSSKTIELRANAVRKQ